MDSPKAGLDVEKELTCSICTETLYQPLTLLKCLHTFCGACLSEWFSFQEKAAERSPESPANPFTCPSCRAPVRDTTHNAFVVTLLDMFIKANHEKDRSAAEKEELASRYKPGDDVLPKVRIRERSADERRDAEDDQRLMERVREMSLREASGATLAPRPRHGRESRSADSRSSRARTHSLDARTRRRDENSRHYAEDRPRQSSDLHRGDGERRRRRRSESRQRQVEHQSSLRSLIGSADMSERDIEREIEDFARQIQEEGLLDGLDLDNIDLTRDDELSRRITEAYRRRQRERSRQQSARRDRITGQNASARHSDTNLGPGSSSRPTSRQRPQSRSSSATRQPEDRSRPPPSMPAGLDVQRRARRRTASSGRSAPPNINPSNPEGNPGSRSQTDVSVRTQASEPSSSRPSLNEARSSSTPSMPTTSPPPPPTNTQPAELPVDPPANASFASRTGQGNMNPAGSSTPPEVVTSPRAQASHRPADLAIVHSTMSNPLHSPTSPGHHRSRSQLFPEPAISCARCGKQHIEYNLHYNCDICDGGDYNLCLDCYRRGKGCNYWLGFGRAAWAKWEKLCKKVPSQPKPHMLTASRYMPPPSTPGGADGRKTLTTDDPRHRLETGTFCVRCQAWTNDCYWRCYACNEDEWGFCNNCVNQGKSCSHMLLPLTHEATKPQGPPSSPRSQGRPSAAAIFTGPNATSIGPFKPLTFNTRCDVCQSQISPLEVRHHCFHCTSALVADASPGDYDICMGCYSNLEGQGQISAENGHNGWRRCLKGHRMVVVGFTDGNIGQWRYVDRDLVGGRALRSEPIEAATNTAVQKWTWQEDTSKRERLVANDVASTAVATDGSTSYATHFPPDGGTGLKGTSGWAWYPKADDKNELLFPKGAEIREIRDINGDWYFGTYMDGKGVFPAPFVLDENGQPLQASK